MAIGDCPGHFITTRLLILAAALLPVSLAGRHQRHSMEALVKEVSAGTRAKATRTEPNDRLVHALPA